MSDAEITSVMNELEALMGALKDNVSALRDILTEPEVPGDHAATA